MVRIGSPVAESDGVATEGMIKAVADSAKDTGVPERVITPPGVSVCPPIAYAPVGSGLKI